MREIDGRAVPAATPATIAFDGTGRAHGTGGCNRFNGAYEADGVALRFGQAAQTNMACAPAAMEQEARFHAALAAVRAWRIEDGQLLLTNEVGAVAMRLVAQPG